MYQKRDSSDSSRKFSAIFSNKKGQVTIFIILGILLLLAVALIIVLQKEVLTFERKELVPLERGPVESFVTNCLKIVTNEALFLMGQQGGFIQLPQAIAADANLHLKTSPFTAVPYWAYGEVKDAPSLEDLKNRLDQHIEQNLPVCVLSSQAFKEAYDLVERSPAASDTAIADKKILFKVDWDIQVKNKQGEIVTELRAFALESPVRLKAIRELAVKIIERELREFKFEDLAQDLLALEHPDVPLVGTEFSCSEKRWRVNEVKQGIKDLLRVNFRELKVKGTEFVNFPEELPYYENHYIWDLEDSLPRPDLSARFAFEDNYPFTFEVTPRSGQFLKSSQLGNKNELISVLCLQNWKFVYTLNFPVLIEVTDETTGYTLKLGSTVHLKNNVPDRSGTLVTRKTTYFDTFDDDEFCRDARIPMAIKTYELAQNPQTGVNIREPLPNVDIEYHCLKFSCNMGTTQYDYRSLGDVAAYKTNFPYCSSAVIRGNKDGYKDGIARTPSINNQEIELNLVPLKLIPANNIKVVKHALKRSQVLGPAEDLEEGEMALVSIKFRENASLPPLHEATLVKSPELDEQITAEDKLALLAKATFTYDLEISLLDGEAITGGYKGKWLVPWEVLQAAQAITFHMVSESGLSETEQLELFLNLEQSSINVPLPEIK